MATLKRVGKFERKLLHWRGKAGALFYLGDLTKLGKQSSSYAGQLFLLGLRLENQGQGVSRLGIRFINGIFTNPQW